MPKAHRVLIDRVSGYADEAGAFVRRRRLTRRPFIRLYYADGHSVDLATTEHGESLFDTARSLIELGERGERPKGRRGRDER
jgi:hypothetical protein